MRAQGRDPPAVEHLLRGILGEPAGAEILRHSGADLATLDLALASSAARSTSSDAIVHESVVRLAQLKAKAADRQVTIPDLLAALFGHPKSKAVRLLEKHGANRVDVLRFIAHGLVKGDRTTWLPEARVVRMSPTYLARPGTYQVVAQNDDFTSREFVVDLLCSLFGKSTEDANQLAMTTHESGRAVIAVYELEKALRRIAKATRRAEKAGFPLRLTIEPTVG